MLVLELLFVMEASWEWIFTDVKAETRNTKLELNLGADGRIGAGSRAIC
jgi:hypothetical protein